MPGTLLCLAPESVCVSRDRGQRQKRQWQQPEKKEHDPFEDLKASRCGWYRGVAGTSKQRLKLLGFVAQLKIQSLSKHMEGF